MLMIDDQDEKITVAPSVHGPHAQEGTLKEKVIQHREYIAIIEEVKRPLTAGFIREAHYLEWLSKLSL